jgi:hypothetical protein
MPLTVPIESLVLGIFVLAVVDAAAAGTWQPVRFRHGLRIFTLSPLFSPGREARVRRCLEIQGVRGTKRAGVLASTSSTFSERNAVDSGRCAFAAANW